LPLYDLRTFNTSEPEVHLDVNKFGFFLLDAINVSIAKTKHINAFCEQNVEFLCNVKAGGTYSHQGDLRFTLQ
jgi:hypothetical protein